MISIASKQAQNRFGELLDTAQREPVVISKMGREVAVLMSRQEYERLQAIEDALWGAKAEEALRNAEWLSPEESVEALKGFINAEADR